MDAPDFDGKDKIDEAGDKNVSVGSAVAVVHHSSPEIGIDEFDPVAGSNGRGSVILGVDEPAVVFHDEVPITLLEQGDEPFQGRAGRHAFLEPVDDDGDGFSCHIRLLCPSTFEFFLWAGVAFSHETGFGTWQSWQDAAPHMHIGQARPPTPPRKPGTPGRAPGRQP